MSHLELPPLDPQVASLLVSEKILVGCEAHVKARAFARAAAAAGALASAPAPRSAWRHAGARLSLAAVGFVVVAAAGSAAFQAWRHVGRPAETNATPKILLQNAPLQGRALVNETAVGQARSAAPSVPKPESSAETRHEPSFVKLAPTAAERAAVGLGLLERARVAVRRGDCSGALGLISEHERRFPTGALTEEREALRIRALSGLGQVAEAQRAAASFRVRFPRSVFLSHMTEISQQTPSK